MAEAPVRAGAFVAMPTGKPWNAAAFSSKPPPAIKLDPNT
jgi:hypothetical protein